VGELAGGEDHSESVVGGVARRTGTGSGSRPAGRCGCGHCCRARSPGDRGSRRSAAHRDRPDRAVTAAFRCWWRRSRAGAARCRGRRRQCGRWRALPTGDRDSHLQRGRAIPSRRGRAARSRGEATPFSWTSAAARSRACSGPGTDVSLLIPRAPRTQPRAGSDRRSATRVLSSSGCPEAGQRNRMSQRTCTRVPTPAP
jgi:hypothetical protein